MLVKYAVYNSKSPIEKIQFEENNYGKPRVKGWNLNYNVSHSGNYVVLAINNKDIGIDIQEKFEIDFGVLQFFHKFEQKAIQKDPSLFFTFWSLKESYLKYLGVGLSRSLDSFVIMNYPDFKCNEDRLITFESIDIDNDNYSSYICYRNNEKSQIDLLEVSEHDLISTIGKYSG
nr:4'-phosphopantetheinyl transferase superfamily protein [Streptococcus mutans]